ncbi:unnamed protein product [Cunninghamella blakesleeana]
MKNPFAKEAGAKEEIVTETRVIEETVEHQEPIITTEKIITEKTQTEESSSPINNSKQEVDEAVIVGYSHVPFVFEDAKLQYYTYAIDLIAFLWAAFMIFVYLTRRFGTNSGKVKRPIAFAVDTVLAAAFGVASFYQFATYNCPPGYYDGWCNFHNTGKFFLLSLFISYVINMFWDFFGGLTCLRSRKD